MPLFFTRDPEFLLSIKQLMQWFEFTWQIVSQTSSFFTESLIFNHPSQLFVQMFMWDWIFLASSLNTWVLAYLTDVIAWFLWLKLVYKCNVSKIWHTHHNLCWCQLPTHNCTLVLYPTGKIKWSRKKSLFFSFLERKMRENFTFFSFCFRSIWLEIMILSILFFHFSFPSSIHIIDVFRRNYDHGLLELFFAGNSWELSTGSEKGITTDQSSRSHFFCRKIFHRRDSRRRRLWWILRCSWQPTYSEYQCMQ